MNRLESISNSFSKMGVFYASKDHNKGVLSLFTPVNELFIFVIDFLHCTYHYGKLPLKLNLRLLATDFHTYSTLFVVPPLFNLLSTLPI